MYTIYNIRHVLHSIVIEFFSSLVRTRARRYNIAVVDRRFNKLVVDPVGPRTLQVLDFRLLFPYTYLYIYVYIYWYSDGGDGCALLCTPPRIAIISRLASIILLLRTINNDNHIYNSITKRYIILYTYIYAAISRS